MNQPPPPPPPSDQKPQFKSYSKSHITPPQDTRQISDLNRRVRMTEESLSNLRKKVELENENRLKDSKKTSQDISNFFGEMDELKRSISVLKNDFSKMIREIQQLAKQEDVKVLQKYIDLWRPINFVTQDEIQDIVADEIFKYMQKNQNQMQVHAESSQDDVLKPFEMQKQQNSDVQNQFDQISKQNSENELENQNIKNDFDQKTNELSDIFKSKDTQSDFTQKTSTLTSQTEERKESANQDIKPSPEQKKRVAEFIEEHEDIKDMLLQKPQELIEKIQSDEYLQKLFAGIDINELSQKLNHVYSQEDEYIDLQQTQTQSSKKQSTDYKF